MECNIKMDIQEVEWEAIQIWLRIGTGDGLL
jgi:hypothetical protein